MIKKFAFVFAFAFCVFSHAFAQNWTRFRGPNGQGHSDAKNIPIKWSEKDYLWKVDLPGTGHSSPVIWDDKLFITCCDQKQAKVSILALSTAEGKTLWEKTYQLIKSPMNGLNSYAASTPAVDEDSVFVIWPTSNELTVIAFDHEGNEKWQKTFGPIYSKHGPCVSPILYEDLVVFTQEQRTNNKGLKSRWLAIDHSNGQIDWEIDRNNGGLISHATPCVYTDDSGNDYLVFSSLVYGISAVNPKNGLIIWEKSGFDARALNSPVVAENLVVASCGSGGSGKTLMAVTPASKDKPAAIAYKIEDRTVPFVPSMIIVKDLLFTFHDQGLVVCRDVQTGAQKWAQKPGGKFFGSPICVEDKLYCMNTEGQVVIIKAAERYELLSVNPLGEKTQATPAVADGIMYLRTLTKVFALGPAR